MVECEIKLFGINKKDIIATLRRIWALYKKTELIVDMYIKSSRPKQTRSRIRCTEHKTVLTSKYKLPSTSTKQAYEFDTILPHTYLVDDTKRSSLIDHVRIKKRTTFTRWGYFFDIDEYLGIPTVLEIEGPDEKSIQKVIGLLGWEKHPTSVCGGKWVYAYYDVTHPEVTSWFVWRLLSLIRCL